VCVCGVCVCVCVRVSGVCVCGVFLVCIVASFKLSRVYCC